MPNLRVSPDGLSEFAGACARSAGVLRGALADGSPGPSFQASARAVATSDSMVRAASKAMADRVDDLSSKLTSAASQYRGRDQESGDAIDHTVTGSSL